MKAHCQQRRSDNPRYPTARGITDVSVIDPEIGNSFLWLVSCREGIQCVTVCRASVDDDGVGYLRGLRHLKYLDLADTAITDESLSHIASLEQLQALQLPGTRITNEGLRDLRSLNQLTELDLSRTSIDDEGLRHVLSLPRLERIYLAHTGITNAGVESLKSVGSLRSVTLSTENGITFDQVRMLQDAFARLDIDVLFDFAATLANIETIRVRTAATASLSRSSMNSNGSIDLGPPCGWTIPHTSGSSLRRRRRGGRGPGSSIRTPRCRRLEHV